MAGSDKVTVSALAHCMPGSAGGNRSVSHYPQLSRYTAP